MPEHHHNCECPTCEEGVREANLQAGPEHIRDKSTLFLPNEDVMICNFCGSLKEGHYLDCPKVRERIDVEIVKKKGHQIVFSLGTDGPKHTDTEEDHLQCKLCSAYRELVSGKYHATVSDISHNKGCKYYRMGWEDQECIDTLESYLDSDDLSDDDKACINRVIEIIKG